MRDATPTDAENLTKLAGIRSLRSETNSRPRRTSPRFADAVAGDRCMQLPRKSYWPLLCATLLCSMSLGATDCGAGEAAASNGEVRLRAS